MKKKHIVLALAGVAILVAVLVAAWPRPKPEILYEVIFLPTLGGSYAGARAINDRGQVVGIANVWRTPWQDLLWPECIPIRQLPQVPTENLWHLILWDEHGGMKDLGLAADLNRFECALINNVGQVAATGAEVDGSAHAFLQDPNGTRHDLRGPDGEQVYIRGLDNRGQVVGYSAPDRGPRRAFLWDKTRGMQNLAPPGTIESLATGINDVGQVVGYVSLDRSSQWHAFLWDPNVGTRDLGPSPFGPLCACQINNRGLVFGQFSSPEDTTCFSTWTPETGVRRVRSFTGTSSQIAGLNDANRFIVCVDRRKFWIWKPSSSHVDSYLCDLDGHAVDIASRVNYADVYEFLATGINNQGQITGLFRSKDRPRPQGVIDALGEGGKARRLWGSAREARFDLDRVEAGRIGRKRSAKPKQRSSFHQS